MMRICVIFLILPTFIQSVLIKNANDEWIKIVKSHGYECEAHEVETQDGYILRVHRILPKNRKKITPVFMQHGIVVSSGDFIVSGPNNAPGFYLSDNGYDVWFGNFRGNKFSVKHRNMSMKDPKFWNFSFHEMGRYDLPAMIDYTLKQTKSKKLFFVGHSQGATAALVMLSTYPKYNEILMQTHLISAVAIWEEKTENFKTFVLKILTEVFKTISYFDQLVNNPILSSIWSLIIFFYELCPIFYEICKPISALICGANKNGDLTDWRYIFRYHPNLMSETSSMKEFNHFAQLLKSGKFQPYDYIENNMKYYRTLEPVKYNIQNISSPTYIYAAEVDSIIGLDSQKLLKNELKSVRKFKVLKDYSHCDMMYGYRVRKDFYNEILYAIRHEKTTHD